MPSPGGIVPAQLGFLAIFNPSLGNTDETLDDQIVYYSSVTTLRHRRRRRTRKRPTENVSQEERNERLRQIGLAQGMVDFSRSFSGGQAVDAIDTEKSRVILHELEPGWWILASIDMTRLPLPPKLPTGKTSNEPVEEVVEYSSKEIKPPVLLLQDLLRAHSTFLLHHGSSLGSLFARSRRSKFVGVLSRYWDLYLSTWNVMLEGNPARNVFGGINIAASGELGIGVGEEERGSGEREVLEGLVGRIEGLVDLVVSKFGDHDLETEGKDEDEARDSWLGTGQGPGPEDGAIFLGTGALSRNSIRGVTHWMEDLYTWGENAYGVIESPTSFKRTRRAKKTEPVLQLEARAAGTDPSQAPGSGSSEAANALADRRGQPTATVAEAEAGAGAPKPSAPTNNDAGKDEANQDGDGQLDKLMSYMKLGYGTYWSIGKSDEAAGSQGQGQAAGDASQAPRPKTSGDASGHYLIGLMGTVEESGGSDDESRYADDAGDDANPQALLRTVHIELEEQACHASESGVATTPLSTAHVPGDSAGESPSAPKSQDVNKTKELRVVVYVNKPFIFTFLFQPTTDSLALDSMYRSLHYQLAPLRKPLLSSTAYRPERPSAGGASSRSEIYDLVWDPAAITVHSTIPNIPDPTVPQNQQQPGQQWQDTWSRAEAMNTHMQLLNIYGRTRSDIWELERTCKTNRGWWVVWTRMLDRPAPEKEGSSMDADADADGEGEGEGGDEERKGREGSATSVQGGSVTSSTDVSGGSKTAKEPLAPTVSKEVFLIRRASDHQGGSRSRSGSYAGSGGLWPDGGGKLAAGIGVDTRRYIEGLLNMDR